MPDDTIVQQVLDVAMRVGEVLLSSGEGVAETSAVMLRVADAGGLPTCDVDITFTSITMCCHRGMSAAPVTTMRLVRYRSLDLTRLTEVGRLVRRVERGELDIASAAAELRAITRARHPYPRWLATMAWAGMAASIAVLLGAGPVGAVVAFGVTAVIDRVGRLLNRRNLPLFFQQVVGAMLATGVTLALFALGLLPPGTRPSLVVAAAITVLLSGLSVVGAVRDAVDGFYLTAAGRLTEIAMFTAGLLAGVVFALKVGATAGAVLAVAYDMPQSGGAVGARFVAAGLAAGFFALAAYAPVRYLPAAVATGAVAWSIFSLAVLLDFGPVIATGVAAAGLGIFAGLMHLWTGVPRLVITIAGITPLLPGLAAYRGFYQLAVSGAADGLVTIILALAIGLALAGGAALGEWVTSHLPIRAGRAERVGGDAGAAPTAGAQ